MTDNAIENNPKTAGWRAPALDCGILLAVWLFLLLCTMPYGEFPLNDDWNYARSVKTLLDEHRLIVTHWALAASLPHILLGAAASLVNGFSFAALRAVSMLGGYASGALTYFLARQVGAGRAMALLSGVLWLTNPLVFNLGTTFMTDLTFMMLAGFAISYMARIVEEEPQSWRGIGIASVLSVLACLTRQTGLVIPIAFIFASRFKPKSFVPLLASGAAVFAFEKWLDATVGTLQSYRVEQAWIQGIVAKGPVFIMSNMMSNLICAFVYIGLFLFPLLFAVLPGMLKGLQGKARKNALIMLGEPIVLLAVGLIITHSVMPLGDNLLFNLGLGPILVGGGVKPAYVTAPAWFWIVVTICGVIGAGAISSILITVISQKPRRAVGFLLWVLTLYLTVICFRGFFDRYLIFPMFLLLPMVAAAWNAGQSHVELRVLQPLAYLMLLLYAAFSVAGTHDYFAWNRARWQAVHDLVDINHVTPMDIDGGLEFNGWWSYDPQFRDSGGVVLSGDMSHGNEYIIAMQTLPGFEPISRYSFQRWLPSGAGEIVVLRRVH